MFNFALKQYNINLVKDLNKKPVAISLYLKETVIVKPKKQVNRKQVNHVLLSTT